MTFELKIYSRRYNRYLDYRIEKIENGWDIKYVQTGSVAKNLAILQNQ